MERACRALLSCPRFALYDDRQIGPKISGGRDRRAELRPAVPVGRDLLERARVVANDDTYPFAATNDITDLNRGVQSLLPIDEHAVPAAESANGDDRPVRPEFGVTPG